MVSTRPEIDREAEKARISPILHSFVHHIFDEITIVRSLFSLFVSSHLARDLCDSLRSGKEGGMTISRTSTAKRSIRQSEEKWSLGAADFRSAAKSLR